MTLTETAISDHIGGIETDGYSILEDAIEPELVEQLLTTVRRVEAADRLLELLGYRLYKGIMGHVDGLSPGEVAFGPRMAETAYRDSEARGSRAMVGE
jgi:hypothetical protein